MATLQGSYAQAAFVKECLERKLEISEPIVDIYGYDYLINISKNTHLKIQCKSVSIPDKRNKNNKTYKINVRHGAQGKAYKDQFHFMVAFIIPLNLWYIIPIEELNKTTIRVNPFSTNCKYKKYLNSWFLIKGPSEKGPM